MTSAGTATFLGPRKPDPHNRNKPKSYQRTRLPRKPRFLKEYPPYSKSRNKSWYCPWMSPQIFSGASNSNNAGCPNTISRVFVHMLLTSASVSCTSLPGGMERKRRINTVVIYALGHITTNLATYWEPRGSIGSQSLYDSWRKKPRIKYIPGLPPRTSRSLLMHSSTSGSPILLRTSSTQLSKVCISDSVPSRCSASRSRRVR